MNNNEEIPHFCPKCGLKLGVLAYTGKNTHHRVFKAICLSKCAWQSKGYSSIKELWENEGVTENA